MGGGNVWTKEIGPPKRASAALVGSARKGKIRTSLSLTVLAGPESVAEGRRRRLAYRFEGTASFAPDHDASPLARTARSWRNPIALAREWQLALSDGKCSSRADLARELGLTRARVTQVLGLLDLAPDVVHAIAELGDPLPRPIVTERMLRPLLKLPIDAQMAGLQATCRSFGATSLR
jgi:hypothetical protein